MIAALIKLCKVSVRKDGPKVIKPPSEHREQVALFRWLALRGIVAAHPPNEGRRSRVGGARLKAAGLSRGLPDVLIFSPVPRHPAARGVAIEMKRRKPAQSRVTKAQREWLTTLKECGWISFVAYGAVDAIERLSELGY